MAKRFIDTDLFDDPWFMDLSKDSKIFWVYCITKCNHAGIIELNERLFKFQTGLKCLQTVIKELGNRLVRVSEQYYFIPKFLDFQYPNFPNSKVKSQKSALDLLEKYNIDFNSYKTLSKPLGKGYEYGNGSDTGIEDEKGNEEETKIELVFPFNTDNFIQQWDNWKRYKEKEFKFKYKSVESEQAALKKLGNLSENNEDIAIEIIHQSFANGWKGFFAIKENNNGQSKSEQKVRSQYDRIHAELDRERNQGQEIK